MTAATSDQVETVRQSIMRLNHPSVTPRAVEVVDEDGPEGPAVLVTVRLSGGGASGWDAAGFLALRREARTIALDALGPAQEVRLVYESCDTSPEETTPNNDGDKLPEDEGP